MTYCITFDLKALKSQSTCTKYNQVLIALGRLKKGKIYPFPRSKNHYEVIVNYFNSDGNILRFYHKYLVQRLSIPLKNLITLEMPPKLTNTLGAKPQLAHLKLMMANVPPTLQHPVAIVDQDDLRTYYMFAYKRFVQEIVRPKRFLEWPCKSTPNPQPDWNGYQVMSNYPIQTNCWFIKHIEQTVKLLDCIK